MSVQDEQDEYVYNTLNYLREYVGKLIDYVSFVIIRRSEYNMPIQTSLLLLNSLATVEERTETTNSGTEWLHDLKEACRVLTSIRSLLVKFVSRIPHQLQPIDAMMPNAYENAIKMYNYVIRHFIRQLDELDDEGKADKDTLLLADSKPYTHAPARAPGPRAGRYFAR